MSLLFDDGSRKETIELFGGPLDGHFIDATKPMIRELSRRPVLLKGDLEYVASMIGVGDGMEGKVRLNGLYRFPLSGEWKAIYHGPA